MIKKMIMNKGKFKGKQGGMTDLFLFMIISLIVVLISVVFIYMGGLINSKLHDTLDGKMAGGENVSEIITDSMGKVNTAYQSLYWISIMLIIGMIISIFMGSYLVTTKPIFFVPYLFIIIIAVVVAVGISNAYETLMETTELASTFAGMVGANFILLNLPVWIAIIGMVGAIIMFSRMGSREQDIYGSGYNGGYVR